MNRLFHSGRIRLSCGIAMAAGLLVTALAGPASGEERKFVVMLATSPKSAATADTAPQLPNVNDIWDAYFDRVKDQGPTEVDSFAEYWSEISYGNVSVSGDAVGWVEVPWPILPQGDNFSVPDDAETLEGLELPFIDLNRNGILDSGGGEEINQYEQMLYIDYNGDLDGTGWNGGPVEPTSDIPTSGLVDFANHFNDGLGVWTPGERFRDLDGDGRYDALLEPTRDGWGTDISDCCIANEGSGCDNPECQAAVCAQMGSCCDQEGDPPIQGVWTQACADLAFDLCTVPDSDPPISICQAECEQDGEIDSGEFCDLDNDGQWDFPEPFEDFLVIYNPGAT
ncbi:MAG: hypothetical protein JXQ75_07980 [Phycisphaerae bacterium]|nr:hypothetical protein [Phycisphaerae bacterium]